MKLQLERGLCRYLIIYLWLLPVVATGQLLSVTFGNPAQQNLKSSGQPKEIESLTLNKSVKGTIPTNDSVIYSLNLEASQYLRLEIISAQADVSVIDPSGKTIAEQSCDNRQATPFSIVSTTAGQYLFIVRSADQSRVVQQFTLRLAELRTSSPQDPNRIQAEQVFNKGVRLRRKWQTNASETALKLFLRALDLWTSVADIDGQVLALLNLGRTYESVDQTLKALQCYERALKLSENIFDKRRVLEVLARFTSLYASTGESAKAVEDGNRALTLSRDVQDRQIEAETLNNIGDAEYILNNPQLAVDYYKQALALWDSTDDLAGKAQVETSFGYAYLSRSEAENASKSFHDAVAFSRQANNRQLFALALRGLGSLYTKLGQPQRGLEALREALEVVEKGEGQLLKARILAGIGYAYERLGDSEKALAYDSDAIHVFQQIGNKWGEGELLMDLGRVYYFRTDNEQALVSYNRALSIFHELKMSRYEAQTLSDIGLVYNSWGHPAKAVEYYNRALDLTRGNDNRSYAYTLNYAGELEAAQGRHAEALKKFNEALALIRHDKDPIGEAITLYNLARSTRDLGQLSTAAANSEAALKIIESIRASVAGENLRASFGASVHQQYELLVDILMQQNQQQPSDRFDVAALEASERGRARSWLESFVEGEVDIRAGVDQSLLNRADRVKSKLEVKGQEGIRLQLRPHTREEEQAFLQGQSKLAREWDEIQEQIRANSLGYGKLPPVPVISGEQIQKLLDNDSLLLEFSLGEDRSYVWLVSSESVKSFTLPGREVIETTCKDLYYALAATSRDVDNSSTANHASVTDQDTEVNRLSQQLSTLILGPFQDLLQHKRLLIVSDGALQYIPFEVLATSPTAPQDSERLLIDHHEIVYLPSASVFAQQQGRLTNRPQASRALAIFADPVFDNTDERFKRTKVSGLSSPTDPAEGRGNRTMPLRVPSESNSLGALRAAGFDRGIPRLPYSYQEAQRIIKLLNPSAERLVALGFDANRRKAINTDLASYRLLHFATHGILNSEDPELSGVLLSMVDRNGKADDGFLQLHEIYELHLPVELVVLSACQTALGKDVRGEGLFGLTRGFIHAGAKQVVSSLWKVDDSATADLMELFYKELLVNGQPAPSALQKAKIELRKQKRWQRPFYWAGFIIQGDSR